MLAWRVTCPPIVMAAMVSTSPSLPICWTHPWGTMPTGLPVLNGAGAGELSGATLESRKITSVYRLPLRPYAPPAGFGFAHVVLDMAAVYLTSDAVTNGFCATVPTAPRPALSDLVLAPNRNHAPSVALSVGVWPSNAWNPSRVCWYVCPSESHGLSPVSCALSSSGPVPSAFPNMAKFLI